LIALSELLASNLQSASFFFLVSQRRELLRLGLGQLSKQDI